MPCKSTMPFGTWFHDHTILIHILIPMVLPVNFSRLHKRTGGARAWGQGYKFDVFDWCMYMYHKLERYM